MMNNINPLTHSCHQDTSVGVPRKETDPSFANRSILLIGFTARAMNTSAKACKLKTMTIDCFADMDLRRLADKFIHVNLEYFRDSDGKLEHPTAYYLRDAFEKNVTKSSDFDFILCGSGFENAPEHLKPIADLPNYCGNSYETVKAVRDFKGLSSFLKEINFQTPGTLIFNGKDELKVLNPNFPIIIKSQNSGGGFAIYKANNMDELETAVANLVEVKKPPYMLQDYIQGIPMSCSFLADGKSCEIILITEQILGDHRFGCQNDFAYCGNIVSSKFSNPNSPYIKKLIELLKPRIDKIVEKFGLKGSNGLDFVLKIPNADIAGNGAGNGAWNGTGNETGDEMHIYNNLDVLSNISDKDIVFMEINPRFQGTLDLFESMTGSNLTELHIKSCSGVNIHDLVSNIEFPSESGFIRVIYYSPLDFHIMADLQGCNFRDVPLLGNYLTTGEPMCSIIIECPNEKDPIEAALEDRDLIIRMLGIKSRLPEDSPYLSRKKL